MHELEKRLGVTLTTQTLERALTHRSYAYENGGIPTNERLEFLGDSVLGIIVTDHLYRTFPDLPEGQLARLRASVVNTRALADVSREIGLGEFIKLGKGEQATGGRDKASILADGFEALLGCIYIDCGLDAASAVVHRIFDPMVESAAKLGAGLDWKTSLQEAAAARGIGSPVYALSETGPDHAKHFVAEILLDGAVYGEGEGPTKKEAEQKAAGAAYARLTAEAQPTPASAGGKKKH